eukprot:2948759-Pleurochrysis_carterae.AAC.3
MKTHCLQYVAHPRMDLMQTADDSLERKNTVDLAFVANGFCIQVYHTAYSPTNAIYHLHGILPTRGTAGKMSRGVHSQSERLCNARAGTDSGCFRTAWAALRAITGASFRDSLSMRNDFTKHTKVTVRLANAARTPLREWGRVPEPPYGPATTALHLGALAVRDQWQRAQPNSAPTRGTQPPRRNAARLVPTLSHSYDRCSGDCGRVRNYVSMLSVWADAIVRTRSQSARARARCG